MKRIVVEKIEDGMVLDKEVCGPSGNVLLGKGTTISSAMGRRLKNWGINFIYVSGTEEGENDEQLPSISPVELRQHLESKFAETLENPVMKQLFAAVYQYRLQKSN